MMGILLRRKEDTGCDEAALTVECQERYFKGKVKPSSGGYEESEKVH